MNNKLPITILVLMLAISSAYAQSGKEAFSKLPADQQQSLTRRLSQYVNAYRTRNWKALYNLVSDTGKNGVNQQAFIAAMKAKPLRQLRGYTPLRFEIEQKMAVNLENGMKASGI
jgi:hypothetical protein